jgi:sugar lactone lactonase YvrE
MKECVAFLLIYCSMVVGCNNQGTYPVVTTFAGNGIMQMADGKGKKASFANPMGITADEQGDLYIADSHNNLIRKISSDGNVTTLAGNGAEGSADGKGKEATFFYPTGIAVDKNGNVYVSDTHNNLIRKITANGVVTTIAGRRNGRDSARFDNPAGIAVDTDGNLYVADWGNDVIRKITSSGNVINFAGSMGTPGRKNGIGESASFYLPWGIALDSAGNVYVSDFNNNMIRKISPDAHVTTIAGKKLRGSADGKDSSASFFHPAGIAVDKKGMLYIADMGNNKVRKIATDGSVSTLAGSGQRGGADGRGTTASFYKPYGIAVDKRGSVYVADYLNNLVRKISF